MKMHGHYKKRRKIRLHNIRNKKSRLIGWILRLKADGEQRDKKEKTTIHRHLSLFIFGSYIEFFATLNSLTHKTKRIMWLETIEIVDGFNFNSAQFVCRFNFNSQGYYALRKTCHMRIDRSKWQSGTDFCFCVNSRKVEEDRKTIESDTKQIRH